MAQLLGSVSTLQLPLGVRATLDPPAAGRLLQDTECCELRLAGSQPGTPPALAEAEEAELAARLGGMPGDVEHPIVEFCLKSARLLAD